MKQQQLGGVVAPLMAVGFHDILPAICTCCSEDTLFALECFPNLYHNDRISNSVADWPSALYCYH